MRDLIRQLDLLQQMHGSQEAGSCAWQCTPVILALGGLRQQNYGKFETSRGYRVRLCQKEEEENK